MVRMSVDQTSSYTHDVVNQIIFAAKAGEPAPTYTFTYMENGLVGVSKQVAARQDCRKAAVALAPVLASVTLPDGSKYEMTTDRGDAQKNSNGNWSGTFSSPSATGSGATYQACSGPVVVSTIASFSGHLTKLKYPTGGATEWTLQSYAFPPRLNDINCKDVATCRLSVSTRAAVGVKERFDYDRNSAPLGQKTYTHVWTLGSATTTLATLARNASGNWVPASQEVHYYATPFRLPSSGDVKSEYGLPLTRDDAALPAGETSPDGGGRYLSTKFLDGNGNLLRYTFVAYEGDTSRSGLTEATENRRMKSERAVHLDAAGAIVSDVATTSDEFDGLGHYRITTTKTTTPAPADAAILPLTERTVKTLYNKRDAQVDSTARESGVYPGSFVILPNADPWVLNTYSSQTTQVKIGAAISTTKALFLFASDTGFLKRRRILKNIGNGVDTQALHANDLLAVFTQNGGNLESESYYGGDGQSFPDPQQPLLSMPIPGTPVTQIAHTYHYGSLETSKYGSLTTVNREIDPFSGRVSSSSDPADVKTRFKYDTSGRMIWSLPVKGLPPAPETTFGGVTQYVYAPPPARASATINQRDGSETGTVLSTAAVDYDDLGRVWVEKRLMPSNLYTTRQTLYDDRGMVASVSEWGSVSKVTSYTYDALGRVVSTKAPDDSVTELSYSGLRTITRTSKVATTAADNAGTAETTTETMDDFGRLVRIVEPIGTVTDYGYDVGNHLATVKMTASEVQNREFHYDGRGLLESEVHPESGTTTYKYDARGHVTERAGAAATVKFQYDAAERLVRVAEGANTLEEFIFDRPNDDDDKSMGKLDKAIRHNYGTPYGDLTVTETFRYRQPGGRLSAKETKLSHTGETFTDSYVYNSLGAATGVTYPECVSSCSFTPSLTVTNSYTKGFLTGVVGYTSASGIKYSNNGMVTSVQHLKADGTNGPLDQQTVDPNTGMARPLELTVTNFCDNFSAELTPKSVPANQSANLPVSAPGATTYKWFEQLADGTSVAVSPAQTGPILTTIVNSPRQFWVRAGNGICTIDSNVVTVSIDSCTPPSAAIDAPLTMNRNATALATVPASSNPNATYTWSIVGGTKVTGENTRNFTFKADCAASTVQLSVVVTAGANCQNIGNKSITTSPAATATLSVSGSSTIAWSAGKPINVTLTGTAPWSGTWSADAPPWNGSASSFSQTVTPDGTTTYTVNVSDATNCVATSNPLTVTVTPPTPVITATALSSTQVQLNWSVPAGFVADAYDVERSTSGLSFAASGSVATTSWLRTAVANTAYLYRVQARKSGTSSAPSAPDLATTVIFVDDPAVAYSTELFAQHIAQLRTAVSAVRVLAGLPAVTFTDASVLGVQPKIVHIQELRNALAGARSTLLLPAVSFTDPTLVSGGYFKAVYLNQLRGGVQ